MTSYVAGEPRQVQLIGHRDGLRRANATIRRGSHLTLTSAMHAPSAANDNAKALIHFAAQLAIWSTTGVLCWTDFRTVGRQSRSADATGVYGARLRLPLALARTGLSQRSTKRWTPLSMGSMRQSLARRQRHHEAPLSRLDFRDSR